MIPVGGAGPEPAPSGEGPATAPSEETSEDASEALPAPRSAFGACEGAVPHAIAAPAIATRSGVRRACIGPAAYVVAPRLRASGT